MAMFGKNTSEDEKDGKKIVAVKKSVQPIIKTAAAKPSVKSAKADKTDKTEKTMSELYSAEATKGGKGKELKTKFTGAYRVLIHPMITEKAANHASISKYSFLIAKNANKIEVAKAILAVYGVKAESVNIIHLKGKKVNRGNIKGQRCDIKKAIVTLKKGETIQVYEGV